MVVSKNVEQTYTNCASYGNASFYMTDDGTDNDNWFEAYQVNYLEGKKWVEGNTDVAVGDEVVVYGPLARYGDTPETQGKGAAYLYSLNGVTEVPATGGGDEPGGGDTPGGETSAFASNVTWTLGTKAYDEKATVNEVADVAVLKLGTSSAIGNATLTVPATATKLTFYAVSWSGKQSKLVFKSGETELGSVEPAANSGLASSSPYTLTVTDTDKYEISFTAGVTSITVETTGSNKRAALFAVNAQ